MTSYLGDLKEYFVLSRKEAAGIAACVLLAIISYVVTRGTLLENGPRVLPAELFVQDPVFSALSKVGPIVLALLLGLLINSRILMPGAAYSGKYLLRVAIALMGARVTVDVLSMASPIGVVIILGVMAFTLGIALYLGKRWGMERDTSSLIGTGNSICGVSACLCVAPVVNARPHNLHAVIGVISILGLVGVFLVPWIASAAGLTDAQSAVLIGGSLHEIGNVVPAAEIYQNVLGGGDVLGLVLAYKMIRVAMLVVVAYILAQMVSRQTDENKKGVFVKPQGFLLVFVGVTAAVSLLILLEPSLGGDVKTMLVNVSTSLLTVAMAGVGLAMELRGTIRTGARLLPVTTLVWIAQLILLLGLTVILV
jgi:uncharacterized integral membrane protein (TIGR00698 family)